MNVRPALLLALSLSPLAAQDPGLVLARFTLDGGSAVVTRNDVALEMGFHLLRRERGRQARDVLVDMLVTRRAAVRDGVMPTPTEVQAFWQKLQEQLRQAGRRPEEFAAVRNTSEAQWLDDLAVQMAQERLVRKALGLRADEQVSGDMLTLWLQEEKKHAAPETDPDKLPVGTIARVGDTDLPVIDLGMLLLRTSEDEEVAYYVRMAVYLRVLEVQAKKLGVTVDDADFDAAIAEYRRRAASDPRLAGASWEQVLAGEGLTVDALRQQRVFRAKVVQQKVAAALFTDAKLAAELATDRDAVLDRIGPRRHIGLVFVRALDEPNGLIPLDFEAAQKRLEQTRERLATHDFAMVARLESQDPRTATKGGDAGWHNRHSTDLPEAVLATAFAMPTGEVSAPIRAEQGVYLVKVLDTEPMPTDAQLLVALRDEHAETFGQQLLKDAAIEFTKPATNAAGSAR